MFLDVTSAILCYSQKNNHILSISLSRTHDFPYRQLIFDGKKTTNICSITQNESQDLGHP